MLTIVQKLHRALWSVVFFVSWLLVVRSGDRRPLQKTKQKHTKQIKNKVTMQVLFSQIYCDSEYKNIQWFTEICQPATSRKANSWSRQTASCPEIFVPWWNQTFVLRCLSRPFRRCGLPSRQVRGARTPALSSIEARCKPPTTHFILCTYPRPLPYWIKEVGETEDGRAQILNARKKGEKRQRSKSYLRCTGKRRLMNASWKETRFFSFLPCTPSTPTLDVVFF